MPIITLTTDFGTSDHYVGVLKGVILGIAPGATMVDLIHQVPRHQVSAAAFSLLAAHHYFPPGTVHLVVVDPGVGSQRRLLAAKAGDYFYVAPDNGVISYVLDLSPEHELRWLENLELRSPIVSNTFHGRDILAPAAAYLAAGTSFEELGGPATDIVRLPALKPKISRDVVVGQIIYVDHFGNLTTNVSPTDLSAGDLEDLTIEAGPVRLRGLVRSYAAVEPGEIMAIWGSSGFLEIARNMARADEIKGMSVGATVKVWLNNAD